MSIEISGIGLGGFILSPVIANLITNFGWRQTYFIMGLVTLVIGLPIVLFVIKKTPEEVGLEPYGADEDDHSVNSSKAKTEIDITQLKRRKSHFSTSICLESLP